MFLLLVKLNQNSKFFGRFYKIQLKCKKIILNILLLFNYIQETKSI